MKKIYYDFGILDLSSQAGHWIELTITCVVSSIPIVRHRMSTINTYWWIVGCIIQCTSVLLALHKRCLRHIHFQGGLVSEAVLHT